MTRVLLADDQEMVRHGLRLILELGGVDVVGEAGNGAEAVAAAAKLDPDIVLMDLRMPVMDGVEATRVITSRGQTKVVALTTFDADELVVGSLRAGAVGFLLKDLTADRLLDAVQRVAQGESVVAPPVLARLMARFASAPPVPASDIPGFADLSEREREVLGLIGAGLSNAEIARDLVVSMATVKTHVRHIFGKLDVRDRAQAVVLAHDMGLARRL